jgi:hypothetical protein
MVKLEKVWLSKKIESTLFYERRKYTENPDNLSDNTSPGQLGYAWAAAKQTTLSSHQQWVIRFDYFAVNKL